MRLRINWNRSDVYIVVNKYLWRICCINGVPMASFRVDSTHAPMCHAMCCLLPAYDMLLVWQAAARLTQQVPKNKPTLFLK